MTAVEPWGEILTLDRLLSMHKREMLRRKQNPQAPTAGCLEGALGNAWTAEQYHPAEVPGLAVGFHFACFALQYIAQNHCLPDGNKRLAWIAFAEILATMQLTVDVHADEAAAFVEKLLVERLRGDDVAAWAKDRLAVLSPAV